MKLLNTFKKITQLTKMAKNKKSNLVKLVCTKCGTETQKKKNGNFSKEDLTCTRCYSIESLVQKNKK